MNYETLLSGPAVEALGRSLLHFFWQGALLAALLRLVNACVNRSASPAVAARVRYLAACAVMVLMVAAVAATAVMSYSARSVTLTPVPLPDASALSAVRSFVRPALAAPANAGGGSVLGWVVSLWFAGVLVLSCRAAGGWIRAQLLRRRGCEPVTPEWLHAFDELKSRLAVTRPVRLCASAMAKAPMVIGWLRPLILVPAAALSGLTEAQLRSILAHELAHIRRYDYLVNLMQTAVETVLFYHPAVWWVGRRMRIERENCCDDIAVAVCGDPVGYARALAELEELRLAAAEPAVAATGGDLLARIRRVLEPGEFTSRRRRPIGAAALVALLLAATPLLWSLSASARPEAPATKPAVQASPRPLQAPVPPGAVIAAPRGAAAGGFEEARIEQQLRRAEREFEAAQRRIEREGFLTIQGGTIRETGPSAQGTELLIKLYDATKDVDVKVQIMDHLASSDNPQAKEKLRSIMESSAEPEVRRRAMDYVWEAADVASLIRMYDSSAAIEDKVQILDHLGSSDSPQADEKLLSIARNESRPELRWHAIDYLASRPKSFDALVNLYDNARDVETKRHVLDYIGSSDDERALSKLFSIAQSDPDRELRRTAVDYLASR